MSMGDRCCHTLYLDAMSIARQVFRERESIAAWNTGKLEHSDMIHQSLISYFDLDPCMSVESILGQRLLKLVLKNTIRQCFDDRDRIYGVLGLMGNIEDDLSGTFVPN